MRLKVKSSCRCFLVSTVFFISACQQAQNNQKTSTPDAIKDSQHKQTGTKKLFSPNWTITAELQNIGSPATVASEKYLYKDWVGEPKLPSSMVDVGSRYQPNPELLSQIKLDQIIDSSWYAHARSLYGDVPLQSVEFGFKGDVATWQELENPTLKIGDLVNKSEQAKRYVSNAKKRIAQLGQTFKQTHPHIKKIAIMQFQDVNTLRLYAKNSLVHVGITKMGLKQATLGKQNGWGFATVPLADLTKLDKDTCVVIIEPHTIMMQKQLAQSLIWQRLDYGNSRCMATIPPLWLYGGINSVINLTNHLATANFVGGKTIKPTHTH